MSSPVDLRQLAIDRDDTGPSRVRTRRHVLTRYILPLVLVVGYLSLVAWASRDIVFPPTAVTVVPVFSTTAEVSQEGTPLFKAAGWIEPRPTPVRVAALAPGVVEQLLVVEDQAVEAGEPVAELVTEDASLAWDQARATLRLRQAELEEARSAFKGAQTRLQQPVHLEAALREAEAALAKIETQRKNLPYQLRRAAADQDAAQRVYRGKLGSKGVVAGVEIDIAKSKLDSSQALTQELEERAGSLEQESRALAARRDALKTQLELLSDERKAKEEAEARVKAAEARVEQARVDVATAQLQLDRMKIRAPIAGRVFRLVAYPGARLGSGMSEALGHDGSTVITMYRPDQLQVRVDVRFENLPQISPQQPVEIDNPALSSPIRGKVLFVSSEADIQKNTVQVKVGIPDPPPVFKPEMLVDVTFLAPPVPTEQDSEPSQELKLYVPQQLVQQSDTGAFVWLADQSEKVARKAIVETGTAGNNGLVEIKNGLKIGSRLVVNGREGLQDGERIMITGEDTSLGMNQDHRPEGGTPGTTNRLPQEITANDID